MCTCCNSCQNIDNTGINFTGIGLSGYRIAFLESHLGSDHRIDLVDGLLVSFKQFQKACLCTCSTFRTKKLNGAKNIFKVFKIHHKFLCPQCGTLSNGSWLCRLEMGKCKCRLIFIFVSELGKLCNYVYQFLLNQFQSFCHNNNVCIISYITGCCSQVDDSLCFRALHTVSIYMGHNIVTYFFLSCFCHIKINIICMFFQFCNLLIGNMKSKLFLSLRKGDPQLSPRTELFVR